MTPPGDAGRAGLRVLPGGRDPAARLGPVLVVVAPPHRPPFPVEAKIVEEDTFLVLSADPRVVEPPEDPMRLMTRLIETRPETPGRVLVRRGAPLRMLAIVHDLNQDPSWRESWVARALEEAIHRAEEQGLGSVGLEMLGCMHGRLEPARFLALLGEAIERNAPRSVRRLWLVPPKGRRAEEIAGRIRGKGSESG